MTIDSCQNETFLSALMDDELPPEQKAAIRRHMESCPVCRQRYEALQQADAMVKGMKPLEPSADFDRTFWRKVADLEDRATSRSWLRTFLTGWRPVLASGLAAGIAAAIFIYTGQSKGPTAEEVFIAQNMELLQNYDVIDHLDMLEQWDAIETMKEPS
jgi:anti-sigma factor RsiW